MKKCYKFIILLFLLFLTSCSNKVTFEKKISNTIVFSSESFCLVNNYSCNALEDITIELDTEVVMYYRIRYIDKDTSINYDKVEYYIIDSGNTLATIEAGLTKVAEKDEGYYNENNKSSKEDKYLLDYGSYILLKYDTKVEMNFEKESTTNYLELIYVLA